MQYHSEYEITEKLSSEFLINSSIGLIILDEDTNIISVNETMLKTFQVDTDSFKGRKFGDVFGCAHIPDGDKAACGTLEKCDLCDIRDGIRHVLQDMAVIKDKIINHQFRINQELVEKRFRISAKLVRYTNTKYIIITFIDITDIVVLEKFLKENEIKYNLLFENMTQGFALHEIIIDSDGNPCDYRYLDFNEAFENLTGFKKNNLLGKTVREALPNTEQYWIDTYGKVALSGEPCRYENYSREIDKYFDVWVFSPHYGQFATIFSDITERVKAENALAESENMFRSYFDNAPDGVLVVDRLGNYIDANKSALKITGYSKEELLTMSIQDITPQEYRAQGLTGFEELLSTGKMYIELPFIRKDKQVRLWDINAARINDNRYVAFSNDITENKELENKLRYVYYHDQLTGLGNRQFVFDNLGRIDNEQTLPLSLITADINGLRSINESFGFFFGDKIIREVAEVIKSSCKEPAAAIRWGGDDFLILLPKTDEEDSKEIIQTLNDRFRQLNIQKTGNISIGMGRYTKTNSDIPFKQAVKYAEENMMQNKLLQNESIQNTPINMILRALHEKNKREEMHSKRVSEICVQIGKAKKLPEEDIYKLKTIGLVHDIGKIGIDEGILNKPAKLSSREFEVMKQHSVIGFRILSANRQTAKLAFYVLTHHERLDGTGYPNGISGRDISLFTRILSVADSFDAMTRKRPYSDCISRQDAVKELLKCSGTQFDSDIVSAFVNEVLIHNPEFMEE